jgi:hypothetical protein
MDWIYHFEDISFNSEQSTHSKLYFRPTLINEKGEHMSGNMFIFNAYAIEFLMDGRNKVNLTAEQSKELFQMYFENLKDKDYFFEVEWKPKGHEYYLHCAGSWYLKVQGFSEKDLLDWMKVFMQIHAVPFTSFKKAKYGDFADENPLIRSLQKAAREGEKTFGKEWWKKDKETKKQPKSPKNTEKNSDNG